MKIHIQTVTSLPIVFVLIFVFAIVFAFVFVHIFIWSFLCTLFVFVIVIWWKKIWEYVCRLSQARPLWQPAFIGHSSATHTRDFWARRLACHLVATAARHYQPRVSWIPIPCHPPIIYLLLILIFLSYLTLSYPPIICLILILIFWSFLVTPSQIRMWLLCRRNLSRVQPMSGSELQGVTSSLAHSIQDNQWLLITPCLIWKTTMKLKPTTCISQCQWLAKIWRNSEVRVCVMSVMAKR